MRLKKNLTAIQRKEFWDRIIYPVQFNGSVPKLIFHVYNVFYIKLGGNTEKIRHVIKLYLPDTDEHLIDKHMQAVADKYQAEKGSSIIRFDCFSCIKEDLLDEDMYFEHSRKHRKVTLEEYKFILQRATSRIENAGGLTPLVNGYFLKPEVKAEYKKYTGREISTNKIAHIMQVLAKYNFLHVTYNSNGSRVVQIGSNNPFYVLEGIPVVDEQVVTTKMDRTVTHLTEQVTMLQSALDSLRKEVEQVKAENVTLQQEKDLLVDSVIERDEQIEHLKDRLVKRSIKRQNVLSRLDSCLN